MTELTPREIVSELDKFIIGQNSAKKAVAIALRSRWRRKKVDSPLREEIFPKNILMIGPTGVGKTEISRRLSKLASAPFLKVEATKFTEVGYVGRDVDQIVRDLIDSSIVMTKDKMRKEVETKAHAEAEKRVIKAFNEHFAGYKENPSEILSRTFKEIQGYDDIVVLRKIDFESHCEHHMLPIIGNASIGYLPNKSIVGISKLARIVNTFAKRLQTQEIMTSQIINAIHDNLNPIGVGVVIEADHHCMKTRGVHKKNSLMLTSQFKGSFLTDEKLRNRFLDFIKD